MKQHPYWWEAAAPQSVPHQDLASECDVAIVGAGYTGLTAALTLATAGKSVQIFDKDKVGAGASSRNEGITSGSLRFSLSQAIKRYGEEKACELFIEAQAMGERKKLYRYFRPTPCGKRILMGARTGVFPHSRPCH